MLATLWRECARTRRRRGGASAQASCRIVAARKPMGLTEDFTAGAAVLAALPPETEATELVPLSFFVAWSGVLTLVYEGFPPCLVDIKATLTESLAVAPEKFGSLWPKASTPLTARLSQHGLSPLLSPHASDDARRAA